MYYKFLNWPLPTSGYVQGWINCLNVEKKLVFATAWNMLLLPYVCFYYLLFPINNLELIRNNHRLFLNLPLGKRTLKILCERIAFYGSSSSPGVQCAKEQLNLHQHALTVFSPTPNIFSCSSPPPLYSLSLLSFFLLHSHLKMLSAFPFQIFLLSLASRVTWNALVGKTCYFNHHQCC